MNIGAKRIHYSIGIKIEQQEVLKKILNNKDLIEKILEKKSNDSKLEINEENLINSFSLDEDELYLVYDTPNKEIEISIEEESEGIKKIFTLGMPIADALCNNKFIVFDELEVGFHPLLSRKIIELFIPKHTKAQLLFTTHNTNLLDLDLFRRDQIYFTSRTKETSFKSVIKSLGEISGVRKSADIEKAYLEGKYSDAPVYNNFNNEEIGEILC